MKYPKIFAHRGLSSKAPENTMAAFEKALEYDIDGIELDVQMAKDDRLVVIHDERLERTTNGKGFVKDYTYSELKAFDAGEWFSHKYSGEKIPLLEEVLDLYTNRGVLINIELKNSVFEYDGLENSVLNLVKDLGIKKRTVISSFNHYSLRKVRDLDTSIEIAILCEAILYEPLNYLNSIGANAIHTSIGTVNRSLVSFLNKNGMKIRCYTVNDEQNLKRLVELGVDGIFTDKCDKFSHDYRDIVYSYFKDFR